MPKLKRNLKKLLKLMKFYRTAKSVACTIAWVIMRSKVALAAVVAALADLVQKIFLASSVISSVVHSVVVDVNSVNVADQIYAM
ncbi:hypothetical protein D9M71_781040 [compost metagenome]